MLARTETNAKKDLQELFYITQRDSQVIMVIFEVGRARRRRLKIAVDSEDMVPRRGKDGTVLGKVKACKAESDDVAHYALMKLKQGGYL